MHTVFPLYMPTNYYLLNTICTFLFLKNNLFYVIYMCLSIEIYHLSPVLCKNNKCSFLSSTPTSQSHSSGLAVYIMILNFSMILLLPPACWSYQYTSPHLIYVVLRTEPRASCMLGKHCTTVLHSQISASLFSSISHQPYCYENWMVWSVWNV